MKVRLFKLNELGLISNLTRLEYKLFCFLRIINKSEGLTFNLEENFLQIAPSIASRELGIDYVEFLDAVDELQIKGLINYYIRENQQWSLFIQLEQISDHNKFYNHEPLLELHKNEIKWLESSALKIFENQTEMALLKKCNIGLFKWLMIFRIFEAENKIIYSHHAIADLFCTDRSTVRQASKKLNKLGIITRKRIQSNRFEYVLNVLNFEVKNNLNPSLVDV